MKRFRVNGIALCPVHVSGVVFAESEDEAIKKAQAQFKSSKETFALDPMESESYDFLASDVEEVSREKIK